MGARPHLAGRPDSLPASLGEFANGPEATEYLPEPIPDAAGCRFDAINLLCPFGANHISKNISYLANWFFVPQKGTFLQQ